MEGVEVDMERMEQGEKEETGKGEYAFPITSSLHLFLHSLLTPYRSSLYLLPILSSSSSTLPPLPYPNYPPSFVMNYSSTLVDPFLPMYLSSFLFHFVSNLPSCQLPFPFISKIKVHTPLNFLPLTHSSELFLLGHTSSFANFHTHSCLCCLTHAWSI